MPVSSISVLERKSIAVRTPSSWSMGRSASVSVCIESLR